MKFNLTADKILSSSLLSTSIFVASGLGKTYYDYKTATPEYKDKFLVKDCVVLSGAALGLFTHNAVASRVTKSKQYNKIIDKISTGIEVANIRQGFKTSLKYTKEIIQDLSNSFSLIFSGVLGALGFDYLLSKTKFEQPEYVEPEQKPELYKIPNIPNLQIPNLPISQNKFSEYIDKSITKVNNENTREVLYTSVTDMPQMRFLTTGMVGAQAIDLSKNQETKDKLKHTTKYLVNDTLIPLAFLSISTALTKGMKNKYRFPIIFGSVFAGTLGTQKVLDSITKYKKA